MTMYVLIENKPKGKYTASLIGWPAVNAQGETEDDGLCELRKATLTRSAVRRTQVRPHKCYRALDNLPRTIVRVQYIEGVPPLWVVDNLDRQVSHQRGLDKCVDCSVQRRLILPGPG